MVKEKPKNSGITEKDQNEIIWRLSNKRVMFIRTDENS